MLLHAVLPWLWGICEAHGFLDHRGRTNISRALNLLSGHEPRTGAEREFQTALWQEVERRRVTVPMPGASEFPGARMTRSATTAEPDMLTRRDTAAGPLTLNAEARRVEATIASDTPVPRSGPNPAGERRSWREVIRPAAIDISSCPVPLLKDHRAEVDSVIGSVAAPRMAQGQLVATITYARNKGGNAALALVQDGHAMAVSVGYRVREWRRVDDETFEAWDVEILEVSSVAIGADRNARVRSGDAAATSCGLQRGREPQKKGNDMNTHVAPPDGAEIPARVRALAESDGIATADMIESRAPVLRVLGDLAERHYLNDGELRRSVNAALAAPDDAAGDRAMRDAVLDVLAQRDATTMGPTREPALGTRVGDSWDTPAAQRAKLSDARAAQVCEALGLRGEATIGRELVALDIVGQVRWLADQRGERGLRTDRQVLDWYARAGAGAHGTSDLPAVASGTLQVVLARSIEQSPIALLECTTRIPASDWRARRHVDFSSTSRLRDQLEAAELQYGTIDETGESIAPPTRKALGIKLTHEAIRNAIEHGVQLDIRLARALMEAANEALRSTIGAQIISPDDLEDGQSPFHASRGTDGGDLVLGVDQLGVAQSALPATSPPAADRSAVLRFPST
jgi:phage head maturation protease